MRSETRIRLDAVNRALAFTREHPSPDPVAVELTRNLAELAAHADELLIAQRAGIVGSKATVTVAAGMRAELRRDLNHLLRIARAAESERPGLVVQISVPSRVGNRAFIASARMALRAATAEAELLAQNGIGQEFLERVQNLLDRFQASTAERAAHQVAHVGASAELLDVAREATDVLRHLDALEERRLAGEGELLAAWHAARDIYWPNGRVKKEGGEAAA